MNIVIDTNVLFSALYRPTSVPGRIIELALEDEITLYAPDTVLKELERNLKDKLDYSTDEWNKNQQALPIEWIQETIYEPQLETAHTAINDASDAPIIATALTVDAIIVSGDKHFHPLEKDIVETYKPRQTHELIQDLRNP